MRDKFYGDKRDLVKWGGIVYLCTKKDIKTVVQVAYYRKDVPGKIKFDDESQPVDLPEAVKKHFPRNIYDIKRLGKTDNLDISIIVIDEKIGNEFGKSDDERERYCNEVCEEIVKIKEKKVIFLDPDTGLALGKCGAEHVTEGEVWRIWESLKPEDFLVFYQHNTHRSDWEESNRKKLSEFCRIDENRVKKWSAKEIAGDVVLYFLER